MLFAFFMMSSGVLAQTSWLDRPLTNWNLTTAVVPTAPRPTGDAPTNGRCNETIRNPESLSDRALTRAGWSLFGASQTYGAVTLIHGMASVDGMCRPNQYNTFVFVNSRFAGTLSPTVMNSRTDGALSQARLNSPTNISADFMRYNSSDALCCPSQTSTVSYTITNSRVVASNVETQANCQQNQNPDNTNENVISGNINYNPRFGRQRNATITVRLVDVSRADTNSNIIAEQQIEVNNTQQFPISYELKYEPSRINQRNRYAIQAEMVSNNRTIARTETNYPVLTQGNPSNVDITLVQSSGGGNQQNNATLRGTISYRERVALPNNAVITVRLLTMSIDAPVTVAETTFNSDSRQVPIPFELGYNRNQINTNQRYWIQAEISIDGKVAWTTQTRYEVLTQGNPTDNIQLILVQGQQTPPPVTGQTLSLSKFGTGSIQIEGRNSAFLVRANVAVKTDGTADVTVAGITGATVFSGKLTYFDQTTLRITVESSGNANAGGEIEVKYNGRRLDSITGNNLTLDGQNVTLRF